MNNQVVMNDFPLRKLRPEHWWLKPKEDEPELSPTVIKCLEQGGIQTVQQLIDAGPDRLLKLAGIGKVALAEIESYLRAIHGETE